MYVVCLQLHYLICIGRVVDFNTWFCALPASVETRQTTDDDNWQLYEMNNYA